MVYGPGCRVEGSGAPPVIELAVRAKLAALVIKAVGDLVPQNAAQRAVVPRVLLLVLRSAEFDVHVSLTQFLSGVLHQCPRTPPSAP